MASDIRLPVIHGSTNEEKINEISKYLFQLAEQLNFELNDKDKQLKTEIEEVTKVINGKTIVNNKKGKELVVVNATLRTESGELSIGDFDKDYVTISNLIQSGKDVVIDAKYQGSSIIPSNSIVRFIRIKGTPEPRPFSSGYLFVSENEVFKDRPRGVRVGRWFYINQTTISHSVVLEPFCEINGEELLSASDREKLDSVDVNAEENVIEQVKMNGSALPISGKAVNIPVDSSLSGTSNNPVKNSVVSDAVDALEEDVADIQSVIPSQATASNKLADKDFVNSSLNSITAFYITSNADGDGFETYADLAAATVFYSGGEVRVPTRNDYCIVRVDETQDDATTRYIYQNDQWEYQYTVNETALTAAQMAALNSGITSGLVALIGTAVQPSALDNYLPLSGGRMQGDIYLGNGSTYYSLYGNGVSLKDDGEVVGHHIYAGARDSQGYAFRAMSGGGKIGGVVDGTANNDAVNVGQMNGGLSAKADTTYVDIEVGKRALQTALTAEIGNRQTADAALQDQIDTKAPTSALDEYLPKTGGQVNGTVSFGGATPGIEFLNGIGEIKGYSGAGTPFHNMKDPINPKDGANKDYVDNGDEWQSAKGEIGYSGNCTAYAAIMYRKHGNNKIDISCRFTVNDVAKASGFSVFDISKVASLVGVNNISSSVGITRISAFSSADGHALGTGTYSGYAGLSLGTSASDHSWQIYRWSDPTPGGGGPWAISSIINSPYKFYGTFDIYGATYT